MCTEKYVLQNKKKLYKLARHVFFFTTASLSRKDSPLNENWLTLLRQERTHQYSFPWKRCNSKYGFQLVRQNLPYLLNDSRIIVSLLLWSNNSYLKLYNYLLKITLVLYNQRSIDKSESKPTQSNHLARVKVVLKDWRPYLSINQST